MMRDFIADQSLAAYEDRFVIPVELLPEVTETPVEASD